MLQAVVAIDADVGRLPIAFELVALLGGGALAVIVGALDDYLQLRARWQLGGRPTSTSGRRAPPSSGLR